MRGGIGQRLARLCLASTVLLAVPALAADRALFIGIGNFAEPRFNLPGIEKDIAQFSDVASRLGYANPRILRDADASRKAMLLALRETLVTGVAPDDRVLIYFSGHGTQAEDVNGDEADGMDEAIVAYDFRISTAVDGQEEIRGVVTDDEIGALLAESPSRNILFVLDACNSGTADKAVSFGQTVLGNSAGTPKFIRWSRSRGSNKAFGKSIGVAATSASGRYVFLSAAGDSQSALATGNGSIFTVGLAQAVAAQSSRGAITPEQMLSGAAEYIKANVSADKKFDPEIHGDTALRGQQIQLTGTAGGGGPNWTRATELVAGLQPLAITNVKARLVEGEAVSFEVASPEGGYLNLFDVGPDDNITLLYPNRYNTDNKVGGGTVQIPTAQMPFTLPAQAPYGRSLVVAIVTAKPFSMLRSSVDGNSAPALATPSLGAILDLTRVVNRERSIGVAGKADGTAPQAWGGKVTFEVCSRDGRCR
ncbi:MAG: hypothetical protein RL490_2143 [Pseudomonadota bacterium]|jgi:hypothetical protein